MTLVIWNTCGLFEWEPMAFYLTLQHCIFWIFFPETILQHFTVGTHQCEYYSQMNHKGYYKRLNRNHRKIFWVQEQTNVLGPFFFVPLVAGKAGGVHRRPESTQTFKRSQFCTEKCLIRVKPPWHSTVFMKIQPGVRSPGSAWSRDGCAGSSACARRGQGWWTKAASRAGPDTDRASAGPWLVLAWMPLCWALCTSFVLQELHGEPSLIWRDY